MVKDPVARISAGEDALQVLMWCHIACIA